PQPPQLPREAHMCSLQTISSASSSGPLLKRSQIRSGPLDTTALLTMRGARRTGPSTSLRTGMAVRTGRLTSAGSACSAGRLFSAVQLKLLLLIGRTTLRRGPLRELRLQLGIG